MNPATAAACQIPLFSPAKRLAFRSREYSTGFRADISTVVVRACLIGGDPISGQSVLARVSV